MTWIKSSVGMHKSDRQDIKLRVFPPTGPWFVGSEDLQRYSKGEDESSAENRPRLPFVGKRIQHRKRQDPNCESGQHTCNETSRSPRALPATLMIMIGRKPRVVCSLAHFVSRATALRNADAHL